MRLKLSIRRNALPATQIVYTTGTGPVSHTLSPNATISDLLNDVNYLVPLESEDGEWGLEDYAVEVSSKTDPDLKYECLHFQKLETILREDDEVTIRALNSKDLQARRLSGRIQITGDGRHLIDGVAFGRQWLTAAERPGVTIPPRKRRKLLTEEWEESDETERLLLTWPMEDEEAEDDDDDEEDDDDFVDEGINQPESKREIILSQTFDDADGDDDIDLVDEEESSSGEESASEVDGDMSDELKLLLQEAAEDEGIENGTVVDLNQLSVIGRRKRKRDQDLEGDGENEFEGFSPPPTRIQDQLMDDDESSESDVESEEDSGSESTSSDSEITSSSGSETDSDVSSDSSSSSDSSDEEEESTDERKVSKPQQDVSKLSKLKQDSVSRTSVTSTTPPGQGLRRTQNNNRRAKLKKRLQQLKSEGILPADANFEDLYAYENNQNPDDTSMAQTNPPEDENIRLAREKVLAQLELGEAIEMDSETTKPQSQTAETPSVEVNQDPISGSGTPDSQTKRARLDVAGARRMLFGSLGLRTPKTTADEEALRLKLSQSVRSTPMKTPTTGNQFDTEEHNQEAENSAWESKLIVSAVECDREDLILPPPPFPFEQGWHKSSQSGKDKKKRRSQTQEQYYNGYDLDGSSQIPEEEYSLVNEADTEFDKAGEMTTSLVADDKTGQNDDDIPIPANYEALQDLNLETIQPDCIIAYKELHVDESTNFQPEISQYRVARVLDLDANGTIRVLLSKKDQVQHAIDEETGQRIYGKFEIPENEEDFDDGTREIEISAIIQPKLVKEPSIQVFDSNNSLVLRSREIEVHYGQDQDTFVPESVIQQPDSANSENDKTKAGIVSSSEEHLLQPISAVGEKVISESSSKVSYPNLSQIEIESSNVLSTGDTSSHQDAQKLSPVLQPEMLLTTSTDENIPDGELIEVEQERSPQLNGDHDKNDSIPAAKSQDKANEVAEAELPQEPQTSNSFLGIPGYDGLDSSYLGDEDNDSYESSLPSLRELTSTQAKRTRSRKRSTLLSPPATRTGLRNSQKRKAPNAANDPELSFSSQEAIKESQIQEDPNDSHLTDDSSIYLDALSPPKTRQKRWSQLSNINNDSQTGSVSSSGTTTRRTRSKAK